MGVSCSFARGVFAVLLSSTALSACNRIDLTAVTTLANAAQKAEPSYRALTQDYHDSCVRTQQWYALIEAEAHQPRPLSKRTRATALPVATAPLADVCEATAKRTAIARWNAWNHLLIAYYAALGEIAMKPSADSDYGIGDAVSAMQNDQMLGDTPQSAKTVAQIASGAKAAIDAYLDARRRNAIADFAKPDSAGSRFVHRITDALITCANDYLNEELVPERTAVDQFYRFNLYQVPGGTQILTGLHRFTKDWSADDSEVEARATAAKSYIASLQSLRDSYDAIAKGITNNDVSSVSGTISLYLADYDASLKQINDTLGKTGT